MTNRIKDRTLWTRFLSGDDEAYTAIYSQHVRSMYSYGMNLSADNELVKDCIHDVFTRLFRNRKNLKPTDNIKLYLFISLKNRIIELARRQVVFCELDCGDDAFPGLNPSEEEETDLDMRNKITEMLNSLTPRQREAIYYRYVENLSFDEIQELMGLSYQSVHNLLQRAMKKLRSNFSYNDFLMLLLFFLK